MSNRTLLRRVVAAVCAFLTLSSAAGTSTAASSLPPGITPQNSVPGLFNNNPQNLAHWRLARDNVVAGVSDAKVLFIGDSTTYGLNLSSFLQTVPERTCSVLQAQGGVPVSYNGVLGTNWVGLTGMFAPSLPSGWQGASSIYIAGAAHAGGANGWSLTPPGNVDTFDIYYLVAGGSFSYAVDGGSATTVSASGTAADAKVTLSAGSAGTHTLTLTPVSGTPYIAGVVGRNSTSPNIQCFDGGVSSSTVANWISNTNPWDALPSITHFAADLTVINLTINDAHVATADATYRTGLQSIITAAKAGGGSCLLAVGNPVTIAYATQAQQDAKKAIVKALAVTNGCTEVDIPDRWGPNGTQPAAYIQGDNIHPQMAGAFDIGRAIAYVLLQ